MKDRRPSQLPLEERVAALPLGRLVYWYDQIETDELIELLERARGK